MLCDLCGENEAVLFIEQTNANTKRKLNLCFECAKLHGVSPDSKTIGRSLAMLFDSLLGRAKSQGKKEDDRLCPVCGISVNEIKMTRKAGCPECYSRMKWARFSKKSAFFRLTRVLCPNGSKISAQSSQTVS